MAQTIGGGSPRGTNGWTSSILKAWAKVSDCVADFVARSENFLRRIYRTKSPFLTNYKVCMRFENLGENCEVGLLQRHFGAEPLGLLRFSASDISDLIAAVQEDFAGVGDELQTHLTICPLNGEYRSFDERYKINSHGLVFSTNIRPDVAHATICRRATFLRTKLLGDLKDGSKIFVFKTGAETSEALVLALSAALRRHGPVTLLCVRPSSDAALHGRVSWLAEGLMGGYLDRVCNTDGDWNSMSHALWIRLLRRALKLAEEGPPILPAPPLTASSS